MKKEIILNWRIEAGVPALNIQYVLHGDKASMSFSFRCPTENWRYWLATGIDYHADEKQYEDQIKIGDCKLRKNGCYCDGSSLAADDLWKEFVQSKLDESIIWNKLEEWMKDRFK